MFISTKTGLFQVTPDLQDCIVIVICTCIGVKKEFPMKIDYTKSLTNPLPPPQEKGLVIYKAILIDVLRNPDCWRGEILVV